MVLFGPRWIFALPYIVLLPATMIYRRRCAWPTMLGAGITLFSIMGLCLPWHSVFAAKVVGPHVRVLTCNTHGYELDAPAFALVIARERPDIIALQGGVAAQRIWLFGDAGWHVETDGELCIASHFPIHKREEIIHPRTAPREAAVWYDVELPFGTIPVVNLHLASPHIPFLEVLTNAAEGPKDVEANSRNRIDRWRMIGQRAEEIGPSVMLVGDFNTPPDSPVFRQGSKAFADAFETAGSGFGYTYGQGGTAARIDHIFTGGAWRAEQSWVTERVGSPHSPLLADLEWVAERH